MSYIGKGLGQGVRNRYYYTATGGETSISGTDDGGNTLLFSDGAYVDVSLNGIALVAGTDYDTATANTISNLDALTASDVVEVIVYDVFSVADSVSKKNGGTFDGAVVFSDATTHGGASTFQSTATFQDAAILNSGTTAQRPASPATGSVRYNTDLELYEGYNGKEWTALSATKTPDVHVIDNSLRFNDDDSAYLSRTPASAGNRKIWTWSAWVKRGNLDTRQIPLAANDGTSGHSFEINASNKLNFYQTGNGASINLLSSPVLRDVAAWYHIILVADTTQSTASNRFKFYVNGVQLTNFDTASYPSQYADLEINNNTLHYLGNRPDVSFYFDGYLSDVYFIDGQALAPTSFGEFDDNGVWNPIAYAGTYGTNGFHLEFETDSALGTDTSGNSNNWTPSGITTDDQVTDTPTVNYATWNPLQQSVLSGSQTLSNGNLDTITTLGGVNSTIFVSSGKWYWETKLTSGTSYALTGIGQNNSTNYPGYTSDSYGYVFNGDKITNDIKVSYGATYTTNDIIGVALDLDAGTLVFYKNGVSQGTAYTGLSGTFAARIGNGTSGSQASWSSNFGQRPFVYTPPTGFVALNSANLPAPAITDGKEHFEPVLYTGNGATLDVAVSHDPDFVWVKERNTTEWHQLYDALRGAGALFSNDTSAESSIGGITLGAGSFTASDAARTNQSGEAYVAWTWNAGDSTVTNTNGTITSQVRANTTAGISIVTWNGGGTVYSVGHGLVTAPNLYIVKDRDNTFNWAVFTTVIDGSLDYLNLNTTAAKLNSGASLPTSTILYPGQSTVSNYVMYCFHNVDGFSKFGSYTGNGSTDGPFIYTGFRPAWVLIKRTDSAAEWNLQDSARTPYNWSCHVLFPDLGLAESTSELESTYGRDYLSNGFKIRASHVSHNASGGTYIYMAFAENPFKTARAR